MPNYQGVWSLTTQMQNVSDWPTFVLQRALFYGGGGLPVTGANTDVIEYITPTTLGNAADFGDMSSARIYVTGGFGSTTRGITGGGSPTGGGYSNVIEYVTYLTLGNATDFGDFTGANANGGSTSNQTRGIAALGIVGSSAGG